MELFVLNFSASILGLLRWREHPDKIRRYLEELTTLDGEEIVKVREGEAWVSAL